MANTGYKRAIIAYKVSKPSGEPLDVNGQLVRDSGRKQAIALLTGHINPAPSKYEIEFYYDKDGIISGNPTITYDVTSCPVGYIRVNPTRLILEGSTALVTFILESSSSWYLVSGPTDYIEISYTMGNAGRYMITARGIAVGQGYFIFRNSVTSQIATIFIANVLGRPWVLEDGSWNMLGFWYDSGIWKH